MAQWFLPPVRKRLSCNNIARNFKAFQRLLLSKVRQEVQALEFHAGA